MPLSPPMKVLHEKHDALEYGGTSSRADITQRFLIPSITLRFQFQVDVDAADNTQANVNLGDYCASIEELIMTTSGDRSPIRLKGWQLPILGRLWGPMPEIATELGNGSADPTVDANVDLPLEGPRGLDIAPRDTILNTRNYNDIQIEAIWNDATDVVDNANGWIGGNEPTIEIHPTELKHFQGSPPAENKSPVFSQWVRRYDSTTISSTGDFSIDLPENFPVRGLTVIATNDGAVDTFIDNVSVVKDGEWFIREQPFNTLKEKMNRQAFRDRDFGGQTYEDMMISDDYDDDGVLHVDFTHDGYKSQSVDPRGSSNWELQGNISSLPGGTNKVHVIADELKPAPSPVNAVGSNLKSLMKQAAKS